MANGTELKFVSQWLFFTNLGKGNTSKSSGVAEELEEQIKAGAIGWDCYLPDWWLPEIVLAIVITYYRTFNPILFFFLRLKLHEDWGTTPAAIDCALTAAEKHDVQVSQFSRSVNFMQ